LSEFVAQTLCHKLLAVIVVAPKLCRIDIVDQAVGACAKSSHFSMTPDIPACSNSRLDFDLGSDHDLELDIDGDSDVDLAEAVEDPSPGRRALHPRTTETRVTPTTEEQMPSPAVVED
jgi:hypothetical protein